MLIESDPHSWASVYNVGPDKSYSLTSLTEGVANAIPSTSIIVISGEGPQTSSAVDSSKFRSQFGWNPLFDIEESIQSIIEYESQMTKNG